MGIVILSFTIKDVHDDVDHLESLGKARTAEVKRDAAVGVALAERDAGVRQAECLKESEKVGAPLQIVFIVLVNHSNYDCHPLQVVIIFCVILNHSNYDDEARKKLMVP